MINIIQMYKETLHVNAQAIIQRNETTWNQFFKLPDLKKQDRLPSFTKKLSLIGYWSDKDSGEKRIHILIRSDRYHYITATRFLAGELYNRGVRKLYIGYPYMLSHDNGNEYNTNTWWFRKIVLWIVDIFMEYGIDVELVLEEYTSQICSMCENKHKKGRIYRGLYVCRKTGEKINIDIDAAINIARRLGYRMRIKRKIKGRMVAYNSVKRITPAWSGYARDHAIEILLSRVGRWS
jgi:transposase